MRIVIEIGWAHKSGGARRVIIKTLLEMIKLRPDNEYFILSNCFQKELEHHSIFQKVLVPPRNFSQTLWDQVIFPHWAVPRAITKIRPDIIFYTNNMVPFFKPSYPSVVIIHDMTPFIMSKNFHYFHALYQRMYFRHAVRNVETVITISENSKQDICRILSINERKIIVVPNGVTLPDVTSSDGSISLENRFGIIKPFILYVGAIHPRKNIKRLMKAFIMLRQEEKMDYQLVIVGKQRWQQQESVDLGILNREKGNIIFTGEVNDVELTSLYKAGALFIYVSLYGGFGLPVLEAMSYGIPVITSNVSSLPEVAGDAALLVNPYDVRDIKNALKQMITDQKFSGELRRRGLERVKEFSWTRTASSVLQVFDEVAA